MAPLSRLSVSTRPDTDDDIATLALLLFSMSGLVLLVASFNLANMLLARGSSRQKEFAIRLAIGGSRFRLVRQLLAENLVLALLGGVVATAGGLVVHAPAARVARRPRFPLPIQFDTAPDFNDHGGHRRPVPAERAAVRPRPGVATRAERTPCPN